MNQTKSRWGLKPTLGSVVAVVAALVAGVPHQAAEASDKGAKPYTTWSDYEGSPDSAQYSALTQINKSNVAHLQQDGSIWLSAPDPPSSIWVRVESGQPSKPCR